MFIRIEKSNGVYEIVQGDDGIFAIYLSNEQGRELVYEVDLIKDDACTRVPTKDDLRRGANVHSAIESKTIPIPSAFLTHAVADYTGLPLPYGYGVDWVVCGQMYLTALQRGLIDGAGFKKLLNECYGWRRTKEQWMQF